jgi:hypothetical protein
VRFILFLLALLAGIVFLGKMLASNAQGVIPIGYGGAAE